MALIDYKIPKILVVFVFSTIGYLVGMKRQISTDRPVSFERYEHQVRLDDFLSWDEERLKITPDGQFLIVLCKDSLALNNELNVCMYDTASGALRKKITIDNALSGSSIGADFFKNHVFFSSWITSPSGISSSLVYNLLDGYTGKLYSTKIPATNTPVAYIEYLNLFNSQFLIGVMNFPIEDQKNTILLLGNYYLEDGSVLEFCNLKRHVLNFYTRNSQISRDSKIYTCMFESNLLKVFDLSTNHSNQDFYPELCTVQHPSTSTKPFLADCLDKRNFLYLEQEEGTQQSQAAAYELNENNSILQKKYDVHINNWKLCDTLTYSADGRFIVACASSIPYPENQKSAEIRVFDTSSGRLLLTVLISDRTTMKIYDVLMEKNQLIFVVHNNQNAWIARLSLIEPVSWLRQRELGFKHSIRSIKQHNYWLIVQDNELVLVPD